MSVDLIISLYTDQNGNDRFLVQHPVTLTELVDITDQFELAASTTDDGRQAITLIQKNAEPDA